jgi:hypothetical protein
LVGLYTTTLPLMLPSSSKACCGGDGRTTKSERLLLLGRLGWAAEVAERSHWACTLSAAVSINVSLQGWLASRSGVPGAPAAPGSDMAQAGRLPVPSCLLSARRLEGGKISSTSFTPSLLERPLKRRPRGSAMTSPAADG